MKTLDSKFLKKGFLSAVLLGIYCLVNTFDCRMQLASLAKGVECSNEAADAKDKIVSTILTFIIANCLSILLLKIFMVFVYFHVAYSI